VSGCHIKIANFEFAAEEIEAAVRNKRLLSMEIDFSVHCNFHCPYCYISEKSSIENELTIEEIHDVILQAKNLGAKRIIILGGEPMIYPHTLDVIEFIRGQDIEVEMFTNGSLITADVAKQLFNNNARVVLKMNTLFEDIQDMLAGKKGAFQVIQDAFKNLRDAGYPSRGALLAVDTIICRQNIGELVNMWQWLRDQNIVPYFEMITPQGNAKQNEWLNVDPVKLHEVFCEIAEVDRTRYGRIWEPQPPLMGNKCLRHQFSCLITSQGDVMPCVGVTISVGNIREKKLQDILEDSEVIRDLRDYRNTIKGPCRTCEKADHCYGCRGSAYQITGDYLASDSLCWKNINRQGDIVHLPVAVNEIIPQKSPMRIVDTLVRVAEGGGDITVKVSDDMLFMGEDGMLDETAYLEMMAQAIAAVNGFRQMGTPGIVPEGLLLGAKKLKILGGAQVGDILTISVLKCGQFGDFSIVKGAVSRDNNVLAQGEIKVWQNTGGRDG